MSVTHLEYPHQTRDVLPRHGLNATLERFCPFRYYPSLRNLWFSRMGVCQLMARAAEGAMGNIPLNTLLE